MTTWFVRPGSRRRRKRMLLVATWLVAVAVGVAAVATIPPRAGAASAESCRPDAPTNKTAEGINLGVFERESVQGLTLTLGESRHRLDDSTTLQAWLEDGKTPWNLKAELRENLRTSGAGPIHNIPLNAVTTLASTTREGTMVKGTVVKPALVRVCVGVNPAAVEDLHPGRYQGRVWVYADQVQDFEIPLEVTVRASTGLALVIAVFGGLLGIFFRAALELKSGRPRGGRSSLSEYVRQPSCYVGIAVGIAAVFAAFIRIYYSNPVWGVAAGDWLALGFACLGFQLSGIGGVEMTRRAWNEAPEVPPVPTAV